MGGDVGAGPSLCSAGAYQHLRAVRHSDVSRHWRDDGLRCRLCTCSPTGSALEPHLERSRGVGPCCMNESGRLVPMLS